MGELVCEKFQKGRGSVPDATHEDHPASLKPAQAFTRHSLLDPDHTRHLGPNVRAVAVLADPGNMLRREVDEDDGGEVVEGKMKGRDPSGD